MIHTMNVDSLENALLAMLPVEIVQPGGSGWSNFNPVFLAQGFVQISGIGGYLHKLVNILVYRCLNGKLTD